MADEDSDNFLTVLPEVLRRRWRPCRRDRSSRARRERFLANDGVLIGDWQRDSHPNPPSPDENGRTQTQHSAHERPLVVAMCAVVFWQITRSKSGARLSHDVPAPDRSRFSVRKPPGDHCPSKEKRTRWASPSRHYGGESGNTALRMNYNTRDNGGKHTHTHTHVHTHRHTHHGRTGVYWLRPSKRIPHLSRRALRVGLLVVKFARSTLPFILFLSARFFFPMKLRLEVLQFAVRIDRCSHFLLSCIFSHLNHKHRFSCQVSFKSILGLMLLDILRLYTQFTGNYTAIGLHLILYRSYLEIILLM